MKVAKTLLQIVKPDTAYPSHKYAGPEYVIAETYKDVDLYLRQGGSGYWLGDARIGDISVVGSLGQFYTFTKGPYFVIKRLRWYVDRMVLGNKKKGTANGGPR